MPLGLSSGKFGHSGGPENSRQMEPDPYLLTSAQAARYLGVAAGTMSEWRKKRNQRGPNFVRIERCIRYRLSDLREYIRKRLVKVGK
jgi:hypothetical protein